MAFSATLQSNYPASDPDGQFERWKFTNGGGDTGGTITCRWLKRPNHVTGTGVTSASISGAVVTLVCVDGGDGYVTIHELVGTT